MSKSKKTLETSMSLDLTPSIKTSVDTRVEILVSNVDCLENWHHILFKRNMTETDICCAHMFCFLDFI